MNALALLTHGYIDTDGPANIKPKAPVISGATVNPKPSPPSGLAQVTKPR